MTSVFTNPLPAQEVEKLGADIDVAGVERGMEALAEAAKDAATLDAALAGLPVAYDRMGAGAGPIGVRIGRRPSGARSRRNVSQTSRRRASGSKPASRG